MATNTKTPEKNEKNDDPKKVDPKTEKGKAEAEKIEKIDPNPVEPGEPYPTGGGDPERDFEAAHGFRRTPKKED